MEDAKVKVEWWWSFGSPATAEGGEECGSWNWQGSKGEVNHRQSLNINKGWTAELILGFIKMIQGQVTRPVEKLEGGWR